MKRRSKRLKQISDDDLIVGSLMSLKQSGGSVAKQSYQCRLCDRVFMSHQALGGHMSIHRRRAATDKMSTSTAAKTSTDGPRYHQCSKCTRQFPTGQALGGHMRSHYAGATVLKAGSSSSDGRSVVSSSDTVVVSNSGSNDLNSDAELDLSLKL